HASNSCQAYFSNSSAQTPVIHSSGIANLEKCLFQFSASILTDDTQDKDLSQRCEWVYDANLSLRCQSNKLMFSQGFCVEV
ncbi:MAG: hypothetical protein ACXWXZ_16905, partial [Candidatus Binatia bacterium]